MFRSKNSQLRPEERDLIRAVKIGDIAVIDTLLGQKVSPNLLDDGKFPILYLAAKNGDIAVVDRLLKAGAEVDKPLAITEKMEISRTGRMVFCHVPGATPLYVAAQYGHDKVMERLIDAHADIDKANTYTGATPIIAAAFFGQLEAVRILYTCGANLSIRAGLEDKKTALEWAREFGHTDVVNFLSSPPPVVFPHLMPSLLSTLADRITARTLKLIKSERTEDLSVEALADLKEKISQVIVEWAPTLSPRMLFIIANNSESQEVIELCYGLADNLAPEIMKDIGKSGKYEPVPTASIKYAIGKWVKEKEKETREKQLSETMNSSLAKAAFFVEATSSKSVGGKTFTAAVTEGMAREAGHQVANAVVNACSIL